MVAKRRPVNNVIDIAPVAPFKVGYQEVPLDGLVAAADNPRRDVGDVSELAASMSALIVGADGQERPTGILQPLVATPRNGRLLIVAGHRRHAAAKLAGLSTAPVIVREMSELERVAAMIVENCQRKDLSVTEEAQGFRQLEVLSWSQRQIAAGVGCGQSHVSKRLALLELPTEVLAKVDSGGIKVADAEALTRLVPYPKKLKQIVDPVLKHGAPLYNIDWRVRQAVESARVGEKIADVKKKLKAAGLTLVKHEGHPSYGFRPPEGVFRIGDGWDELPLDAKQHKKEPCHAVGIDPKSGKVIPLCQDRSQHPGVKTRGEKQRGGRVVPTRDDKTLGLLRELRQVRQAFALELVVRSLSRLEGTDILLDAVLEDCDWGKLEAVAGQFGIRAENPTDLRDLVRASSNVLPIVAGAALLVRLEQGFPEHAPRWGARDVAMLELLAKHGYAPSALERKRTEPK